MTHAFVFRAPLGSGKVDKTETAARAARLTKAGWSVSEPAPQIAVAVKGLAGTATSGDLFMAGMVLLDDRASVAAQLGRDIASDETDLDLALALRKARGPDFAADLPGTFSLVLLDGATGAIECYRDHFGVFPFYYVVDEYGFACGSDIRSVLHLSALPLVANPVRVADFIEGLEIDTQVTAYDGLHRLPTAHKLTLVGDSVETEPYWNLTAAAPIDTDAEAVSALRTALEAAIEARLDRPPGPVGAMLSGGLDSSTLAGLAARAASSRALPAVRTLSLVYGSDKAYDETLYITAANDAFGTEPHFIKIDAPPRLTEIGPLIEEQMELFLGFGLPKSRCIFPEARSVGLGALIDGHGGDEIISHGYGRLIELAHARRWAKLYVELRGAAQVHGIGFWSSYVSYIVRFGGLPPRHPVQRVLRKLAKRLQRKTSLSQSAPRPGQLFSAALRDSITVDDRYNTAQEPQDMDRLHEAEALSHRKTLTDPLVQHGFEVLHRSAVAAGILPLYPFFDRRVVAACLAMPSDTKLRGGRTRWIMREAMRGVLPEIIRTRADKAEFGEEFAASVRAHFQSEGLDCLNGLGDFVDLAEAKALWEQVSTRRKPDNIDALRALWRLVILAEWLGRLDRWQDQQRRGTLI